LGKTTNTQGIESLCQHIGGETMTETEKKEIIIYSNYIEVDRNTLKGYKGKDPEISKEEIEKGIADASRIAIAEVFYRMGRYYADFKVTDDPYKVAWNTDLPLPPTEITISLETQLWDTRIVMKVIEK
jgi:hypothetical protein